MNESRESVSIEKTVKDILYVSMELSVDRIERMKMGLCNEVFAVSAGGRDLIVRLNIDGKFMKGSEKYIPLFRSKGIKVPDILVSDCSKVHFPYCYQILTRIDGDDLGNVIDSLNEKDLKAIAHEIVGMFKKLATVKTDGSFGYVEGQDHAPHKRWLDAIDEIYETSLQRGEQAGTFDKDLNARMRSIIDSFKEYLEGIPSVFYYDDIASKNVMIYKGQFNGLVDLDGVTFGDPLESVGRMKVCFYDSEEGRIYLEAVQNEFSLDQSARKVVTFYAVLHQFSWMYENGIQFNQNTSAQVDQEKLEQERRALVAFMQELEQ